jgi:enoyl-CoA hydratase/carnithine racemase
MADGIFQLEPRAEGVTVIWMDDTSASVNTLKEEMIAEFDELISALEQDTENRTLVFASAKPGNFIVGANLDMIRRIERTEAARALADQVSPADLEQGRVYPPLSQIRAVSSAVAARVAEVAYAAGLARRERPDDVLADIRERMFEPDYPIYA